MHRTLPGVAMAMAGTALIASMQGPEPTRLKAGRGVGDRAAQAANAVADAGGSPRAQIDAARLTTGTKITYLPHQGAKERAKRAARLAAGA